MNLRLLLLGVLAVSAFAQCEIDPAVRKLLDKPAFGRKVIETQTDKDARASAYRDAEQQYPDDFFILRRYLLVEFADDPPAARIDWAKALHAKHSDSPMYELLEASAYLGFDTPQGIRRMEALAAKPDMARAHIELARVYGGFGRFKDKARAQQEADAFMKLCPESMDAGLLSTVEGSGTPAQIAHVAELLRRRLEAETGDVDRARWENLWSLEFKAHPLAEHPAVRKQIAADLAHFEQSPQRNETNWILFLRSGYESMGDTAAVERLTGELLEKHADSAEAKRAIQERFRKEHPGNPKDAADAEARTREHLAAAREWHKRWPDDANILHMIFNDLERLPETTTDQMTAAIDEFQAAYAKKADFFSMPPIEFRIAEAYIHHKTRLDRVPALVETGLHDSERRAMRSIEDDRNPESSRGMFQGSVDSMRISAAGLLLDHAILTKQPANVKTIMAGISSVDTTKPFVKTSIAALTAKAAEAEGRKLDALFLYRAAIDARGPIVSPYVARDELADAVARVWKDLGGSSETFALFREKSKPVEATESRWERPEHPLPSFSLPDLAGQTWTLKNLEGKTLLVNIWATWCGPCIAEHPEFQKLYEKLKDRPNVSVISFNVDEDLGKVSPYIAEHKYTFPVIPAKDVVDAVVPALAIPRNWLVDARGKLQWEQIGFGPESSWQEKMLAKLDEVAKGVN